MLKEVEFFGRFLEKDLEAMNPQPETPSLILQNSSK